MHYSTRRKAIPSWMMAALLSAFAGCGGRGVELVEVSGTVTLDGGPMPAAGSILFTPLETTDGLPARPGVAEFDTSGRYRASTFGDAPGLIPGRYGVAVQCWKTPPSGDVGPPPESFLPERYADPAASGLVLEVPAERRSVDWDLDLESESRSASPTP